MTDGNVSILSSMVSYVQTPIRAIDLPIEALRPSTTHVQAQRRERFDSKALKELAETVREVGVLEPILVRMVSAEPTAIYEIVAGERRWRAAQAAGHETVPAVVRELSDAQVLQLQLIENLQREELHALDEAEGFGELLKHHGYTVEKLADQVSKPRGYIYGRLKLLALCPSARQAFSKGKLTLPTALLLARVPVEALQKEALKDLTESRHGGEPMSTREAARHLQSKYMLRLAEASFPTQDAELIAAAGPCGTCPKRTGSQPELFKDVQGADVCTDPLCFQAKRQAWTARQRAVAQQAGRTLIEGAAAKKIAPHGGHHLQGYVRPTDRCYEDKKNRTYRQLLGNKASTALLVMPETGELIEVIDQKAAEPLLKERGVGMQGTQASDTERDRRAQVKRESAFRWKLFEALRQKSPATLARQDLEQVALMGFARHGFDARKRLLKVWNWDPKKGKGYDGLHHDEAARSRIPKHLRCGARALPPRLRLCERAAGFRLEYGSGRTPHRGSAALTHQCAGHPRGVRSGSEDEERQRL